MIAEIKDAANIANCRNDNLNELSNDVDEPATCNPGYIGVNCETVYDACLAYDPCENGGTCQALKDGEYRCLCPIPHSGINCQSSVNFDFSVHFNDFSYLEMNRTALTNQGNEITNVGVAFMFNTKKPEGLLFWFGQPKGTAFEGQDFIGVAIVDGLLEFGFRLNGEESVIKNTFTRVDDGFRHIVVVKQETSRFSLEVDGYVQHGESRPSGKNTIYLPGNPLLGKLSV